MTTWIDPDTGNRYETIGRQTPGRWKPGNFLGVGETPLVRIDTVEPCDDHPGEGCRKVTWTRYDIGPRYSEEYHGPYSDMVWVLTEVLIHEEEELVLP